MTLERDIESILSSIGLNVYDITTLNDGGETIYRVSITAEDGSANLARCVEATKLISPLLDTNPPLSGDYRLEVSSPGIERKLKTLKHFQQSIGEKVKITLNDKSKIRAAIISVNGDRIGLDDETEILYADILKASTYFEW